MKQCNVCKQTKPVSLFNKRSASPDGVAYTCKVCTYEAVKIHRAGHRRNTNKELAHRYGLSESEYQALIGSVDACEICGHEMLKPHVDHDKHTGEIRGVLCMQCNLMLGLGMHDPGIFQRASTYLTKCRGKYETSP